MGDKSSISWTTRTWNPTVGCTKVSAGCDHCYAETFVNRFAGSKGFPERFDTMVLRDDRFMLKPLSTRWRAEPGLVFVNSLSDLFHKDVPERFIARVFAVMAMASEQTFQLLTKRHGRMRATLRSEAFWFTVREQIHEIGGDGALDKVGWPDPFHPLPNLWLGVSVENQEAYRLRAATLAGTPAAVRWLSMEPLIGEVTFGTVTSWLEDLDWVVVGGESGHGARPMRAEWVDTILDACRKYDTAFHFKQLGEILAREWGVRGKGDTPDAWASRPEWVREYPTSKQRA